VPFTTLRTEDHAFLVAPLTLWNSPIEDLSESPDAVGSVSCACPNRRFRTDASLRRLIRQRVSVDRSVRCLCRVSVRGMNAGGGKDSAQGARTVETATGGYSVRHHGLV
jgi:hypothetical protein